MNSRLTEIAINCFHKIPKPKIRKINGVKMYMDYSKKYGSFARFFSLHEKNVVKEFMQCIENDDVTADLGAYQGDYSLVAANKGCKHVYAFEAGKNRLELLEKNIKLNGFENKVSTHNYFVSDKNDLIGFDDFVGLADLQNKNKINTITLDHFFIDRQFPTVIKIDVEGEELKVLDGMKNILNKQGKLILFVEVHKKFVTLHEVTSLLPNFDVKVIEENSETIHVICRKKPYD